MACTNDVVHRFPLQTSGRGAASGHEAGANIPGSRAVGKVEKAVEVLDSDLSALLCEAQGGIVDGHALDSLQGHLRCLVHHIREAQAAFHLLNCPIHRLPNDVLEHIFFYVALRRTPDSPSELIPGDIWTDSYIEKTTVLKLAMVCRRWRDIALRSSCLWNTIKCNSEVDIRAQLAFTKSGPLELVVGQNLLALPAEVDSTRIRSLHWDWSGNPTPLECEVSLDFYAPTLEACVLSAASPPRRSIGRNDLPLTPFQGQAPRLRQLTLYNVPYSLQLKLENLAHLHLHNCLYQGNARGLHQMLASAPNLVDLVVSLDSQRRDGIVNWTCVPRAQLPRLRRLVFMQLSMAAIQRFLRLIELNTLTAVRIVVPNSASETAMWHSRSSHAILRWIPAVNTACHAVIESDGSVMAFGADAGIRVEGLQETPRIPALSMQHLFAVLAQGADIRTLWLLQRNRVVPPMQQDENILPLPRSVDKVVVHDMGLSTVLRSLEKRREPPSNAIPDLEKGPRRNLPSLHVLLAGSLSAEWVLHKIRPYESRNDWSGVDNVTIACAPSYCGPRSETVCMEHPEEPAVPLPRVCLIPTHRLWPSWKVKAIQETDPDAVRSMKSPPVQAVTMTVTQSQATVFVKHCMFSVTFLLPLLARLRKAIHPPSCPWS